MDQARARMKRLQRVAVLLLLFGGVVLVAGSYAHRFASNDSDFVGNYEAGLAAIAVSVIIFSHRCCSESRMWGVLLMLFVVLAIIIAAASSVLDAFHAAEFLDFDACFATDEVNFDATCLNPQPGREDACFCCSELESTLFTEVTEDCSEIQGSLYVSLVVSSVFNLANVVLLIAAGCLARHPRKASPAVRPMTTAPARPPVHNPTPAPRPTAGTASVQASSNVQQSASTNINVVMPPAPAHPGPAAAPPTPFPHSYGYGAPPNHYSTSSLPHHHYQHHGSAGSMPRHSSVTSAPEPYPHYAPVSSAGNMYPDMSPYHNSSAPPPESPRGTPRAMFGEP